MSNNSNLQHNASHPDPYRLRTAQTRFLYKHSRPVFKAVFLAAVTAFLVFQPVANQARLYLWLGLFALITMARYFSSRYYSRRLRDTNMTGNALTAFTIGAFVSGLMWGCSGLLFLPSDGIPEQTALLFTCFYVMYCCALPAGCLAVYSGFPPAWFSFTLPCMLPLMTILAVADHPVRNLLSILMLIYLVFLACGLRKINAVIMSLLRLRLDKADIVGRLEQEREHVCQLNDELKQDIAKRKQTESKLRDAKAEAEKLAAELLTLSSLDSLTGIANRRALDNFLHDEWNRAIRQGRLIALIICDIDYYKAYNDIYGHQSGDDVLARIGSLLEKSSRRGGELAARYGGEEFVIVLADTTLDSARIHAVQIRRALEEMAIPHSGSRVAEHLTMSFGISAVVPVKGMNEAQLIAEADTALYEAKSRGRNCIIARAMNRLHLEENKTVYLATAPVYPYGNPESTMP